MRASREEETMLPEQLSGRVYKLNIFSQFMGLYVSWKQLEINKKSSMG